MAKLTDLAVFTDSEINDNDKFWTDEYNTATVTMTSANPCVITWTAHGLPVNTPVVFTTTGDLPTNIVAGTTYYIISTGLTTNEFQVSASLGGSAIDGTAGAQSGTHTGVAYVSKQMSGAKLKTLLGNTGYTETFTPTTVGNPNTITHNLATTDIIVELWDASTQEQLFATIDNRLTNSVDVTFDTNPSGDVDVVILSKGGTFSGNKLLETKLTLTDTQIKAGTPIEIIPACGVGKAVRIIEASARMVFNTTPYDGTGQMTLITDTATLEQVKTSSFYTGSISLFNSFIHIVGTPAKPQLVENKAVNIAFGTSATVGDSPIDVYVSYRIIDL
jgi:hypothetical protein